ncbi:unnamed protein product [Lota lota]
MSHELHGIAAPSVQRLGASVAQPKARRLAPCSASEQTAQSFRAPRVRPLTGPSTAASEMKTERAASRHAAGAGSVEGSLLIFRADSYLERCLPREFPRPAHCGLQRGLGCKPVPVTP